VLANYSIPHEKKLVLAFFFGLCTIWHNYFFSEEAYLKVVYYIKHWRYEKCIEMQRESIVYYWLV